MHTYREVSDTWIFLKMKMSSKKFMKEKKLIVEKQLSAYSIEPTLKLSSKFESP